jgi:hypothetical protein
VFVSAVSLDPSPREARRQRLQLDRILVSFFVLFVFFVIFVPEPWARHSSTTKVATIGFRRPARQFVSLVFFL